MDISVGGMAKTIQFLKTTKQPISMGRARKLGEYIEKWITMHDEKMLSETMIQIEVEAKETAKKKAEFLANNGATKEQIEQARLIV